MDDKTRNQLISQVEARLRIEKRHNDALEELARQHASSLEARIEQRQYEDELIALLGDETELYYLPLS